MPCPICDDSGWKSIEVDGVARVTRCDCIREKTVDQRLRDARVPPRYARCTLDNFLTYPNEELLRGMLTEAMSASTTTVQRQSVKIDVMNGTSIEGYETLAATRLNYAGYVTTIIPSDRQDYAYSVLIDKTTTQDSAQSDHILNVLGMSAGSLIPTADPNSASHYLLILGYDYQPCFKPENMGQ